MDYKRDLFYCRAYHGFKIRSLGTVITVYPIVIPTNEVLLVDEQSNIVEVLKNESYMYNRHLSIYYNG